MKTIPTGVLAAVVAAFGLACTAMAQEPDSPVGFRSGFTEGVGTTQPGSIEIEGGASADWGDGGRVLRAGELTVKVPLTSRVEVRVGVTSYAWSRLDGQTSGGHEDGSIGLIARVFERPAGMSELVPSVALTAGSSVPTGAAGYGAESWQPEGKLVMEWSPGTHWTAVTNLSTSRSGPAVPGVHAYSLAGWLGRRISDRIHAYVETDAIRSHRDGAGWAPDVHGGVAYQLSPRFHADIHVGRRTDGSAQVLGIGWVQRW